MTAILAKIAERVIGRSLVAYLHTGKFGPHQWAFTPGLSARDLVTALMMSWILAACTGNKVAAYLGDISGAFDRVFKDYLLAKLQAAGVGALYLNFLDSYLQPRRAAVVVEGTASDDFEIANTVFQGTVLGPPLWNVFFSDVTRAASFSGGDPSLFADDLSVFQTFDKHVANEEVLKSMQVCREKVHSWGRINRVAFDPSKEHQVVIHPIHGEGESFKLLGCMVDCKLLMHDAVENILSQMRPKMQAILRTKPHYSSEALLGQFRTHVWGIMETHSGGIFHACDSLLHKLDSMQSHFLSEIGIDIGKAFTDFNFAPPMLRRNIGVRQLPHVWCRGAGAYSQSSL